MNVLHIIPGLTRSSGPTQALLHLVSSLESAGANVSVAYLKNRLPNQIPPKLSTGNGFEYRAIGLKHWGYPPELRRVLNEHIQQFDVLHIHSLWLYPGLVASHTTRQFGIPYILRPAGSLEPTAFAHRSWSKQLYYKLWERDLINPAARIHAVSPREAHHIDAHQFTPKSITIPNGISAEAYAHLPSRTDARTGLGFDQTAPVLAYVGRLHPIKGIKLLIPVLKTLLDEFPSLRCLIGGPTTTAFASQLQKEFLTAGIPPPCCPGGVDRVEKIRLYHAVNLFLLPSKTETFGIVVAEALACETPVIVSDQTPWQDVTRHQAGDRIPRDSEVWIETTRNRLQDPPSLITSGRRGRAFVMSRFTWSEI